MLYSVTNFTALLARGASAQVQKDPGVIIGPIARLFGYIIDFMFNIVYSFTTAHSLGFAIILLTLVVRFLMLPLAIKGQKGMMAMQKLNPEVEKIRAKYSGSSDPELKQKMNLEIQSLYAKHKVNPLGGCLPLLIQMPFFFGLMYIMNQSYLYVSKLKEVYHQLSILIFNEIPGFLTEFGDEAFNAIANPHIPDKWLEQGKALQALLDTGMTREAAREVMDVTNILCVQHPPHGAKLLNKFSVADWNALFEIIPADYLPAIQEVFNHKESIELFMSLNLNEVSGWAWPGIIIPILAGGFTFLTSWLSMQMSTSTDPNMKTQQKVMMIMMPFFMAFITVSMPAGVGVYWITSSVFQVGQQFVLNKKAGFPIIKKP